MQECLDATGADDFDSGNNGPINWCPARHVDASPPKLDAGRNAVFWTADFDGISEDLHSFGVSEQHEKPQGIGSSQLTGEKAMTAPNENGESRDLEFHRRDAVASDGTRAASVGAKIWIEEIKSRTPS